jgi:hypothetical protein
MVRWRNYFSQILNVHRVSHVRQAEIHTAEPLVPEPSALKFELTIEKLKTHKSPGIDQILAELIKARCRTIRCVIHKFIIAIWNKEGLPEEWKESIIEPIHKKGKKQIVITLGEFTFANYVKNFVQHPALKVNSICRRNYGGLLLWIPKQYVNY